MSKTVNWSSNCTVSTSSNRVSDLTTAIQWALKFRWYYDGVVDGVFGDETELAVMRFQRDAFPGDSTQWDGVVGPKTWAKLDNHIEWVGSTSTYYYFGYPEFGDTYRLTRVDSGAGSAGQWAVWEHYGCGSSGNGWVAMDSTRDCG